MSSRSVIRIPLLRAGKIYESLDHADIVDPARGVVVARLSQANTALIRREVEALALAAPLADFGAGTLAEMCKKAATIYANDALPVDGQGNNLSTEAWIQLQSRTTGLPENLCRRTVQRLSAALAATPEIVEGLTRRLPAAAWDRNLSGVSKGRGPLVSYHSVARHLGVVLPNNSPAVNALWLPAIAFKVPVAIKPGSQDPWTAWRLIQALVRAGVPESVGMKLTGHKTRSVFERYNVTSPSDLKNAAAMLNTFHNVTGTNPGTTAGNARTASPQVVDSKLRARSSVG